MRTMRPIEIYEQLRALMRRMSVQCRLIDCIRDSAENMSPNLSGMPRGGTQQTVADSVSLLVDLERGLDALQAEYAELLDKVQGHMDGLPELPRTVMRMRYVDRKTVGAIACSLNYTRQWVHQLLREAESC